MQQPLLHACAIRTPSGVNRKHFKTSGKLCMKLWSLRQSHNCSMKCTRQVSFTYIPSHTNCLAHSFLLQCCCTSTDGLYLEQQCTRISKSRLYFLCNPEFKTIIFELQHSKLAYHGSSIMSPLVYRLTLTKQDLTVE